MGVLILAQECLVKGGTVYVDPGKGTQTLIKAEGVGVTVRDQVKEALAGEIAADALDPRLVHPYVLGLISGALMGLTFAFTPKMTAAWCGH